MHPVQQIEHLNWLAINTSWSKYTAQLITHAVTGATKYEAYVLVIQYQNFTILAKGSRSRLKDILCELGGMVGCLHIPKFHVVKGLWQGAEGEVAFSDAMLQ